MHGKYLSVCLISLAVLGLGFVINEYRYAGAYAHSSGGETVQATIESQLSGPIRNLRFTLFEQGIRPSDMRVKGGLVNILVEDRSRVAQNLTIQRVAGTERISVGSVEKWTNQIRGRNSFRLVPGEYELFDSTRSEYKAVLTVEP